MSSNPFLKGATIVVVSATVALVLPTAAFGLSLGSITRAVTDSVMQAMMSYVAGPVMMAVNTSMAAATSGIQGEINKSAIAEKNTAEAIASFEAQERIRLEALRIRESLEQPESTCETMATADALGNATAEVKVNAYRGAVQASTGGVVVGRHKLPSNTGNTSTANYMRRTYDISMTEFCTEEDKQRGRCEKVGPLAGADMTGANLFTDGQGNDTQRPDAQTGNALFINRIVGGMPPELLANPNWEKTPQGMAYVDMVRRYAAFQSLAAHSLNSIATSHAPQAGLGTRSLTAAHTGRVDISKMEMFANFVKMKFSSASIQDAATATDPNKILRDMAQVNAFRLAMDQEALQSASRTEALLAAQLSLLAEQQLAGQLGSQRSAAANARGS